jgi:hypothetical protein
MHANAAFLAVEAIPQLRFLSRNLLLMTITRAAADNRGRILFRDAIVKCVLGSLRSPTELQAKLSNSYLILIFEMLS